MSNKTTEALDLLSELLVTVRAIASEATGGPYGHGQRFNSDPVAACRAIQALADAAHNLPAAIRPGGPDFLLDVGLLQTGKALRAITALPAPPASNQA